MKIKSMKEFTRKNWDSFVDWEGIDNFSEQPVIKTGVKAGGDWKKDLRLKKCLTVIAHGAGIWIMLPTKDQLEEYGEDFLVLEMSDWNAGDFISKEKVRKVVAKLEEPLSLKALLKLGFKWNSEDQRGD